MAPRKIDKMTVQQLQVHLEEIEDVLSRKKKELKRETIARLTEEVKEAGFDIHELFGTAKGVKSGSKVPPKYRDPETGLTWSGRGRRPAWVQAYIDEDRLDEIAI